MFFCCVCVGGGGEEGKGGIYIFIFYAPADIWCHSVHVNSKHQMHEADAVSLAYVSNCHL